MWVDCEFVQENGVKIGEEYTFDDGLMLDWCSGEEIDGVSLFYLKGKNMRRMDIQRSGEKNVGY